MYDLLISLGHDVHSVNEEKLTGSSDDVIWAAAQGEKRFLITTDLDFSDVRRYQPGSHSGILLLRLSKEGMTTIAKMVQWLLENNNVQLWSGALVVATDHKVRVRKAGK